MPRGKKLRNRLCSLCEKMSLILGKEWWDRIQIYILLERGSMGGQI